MGYIYLQRMENSQSIAIIGAGPAGLTTAYCLAQQGIIVDIYEASNHIGGMSRTINIWNQLVDLGPHRFFSQDKKVNDLWLEVVQNDYHIVNRLTRIYYKQKFFQYPLQAKDALIKLGAKETLRSLSSYVSTKLTNLENDNSFEYWVTKRFGKRLFEIFFKNYSEKLWGISCTQLDADFAAQRIKNFSLATAIKHSLKSSGNNHKTLISQFAYPTKGTGMVYDKMRNYIEKAGSKIYLNTPVTSISQSDKNTVNGIFTKGVFHSYDIVVSSMPLTVMVKQLPSVPSEIKHAANRLKFRNTILVYLHIDGSNLFPDNWLYIQEPDIQVGRITNFRNWVPELYGSSSNTILALEYWCYNEDKLWQAPDEELIELGKKELQQTGLLKNHKVLDGYIHKIPRCYPVYHKGYKNDLAPIIEKLQSIPNLYCIGRYGSFKYNNQDHSILMGLLAAENIYANAGYNLWNINTDYDNYQEKSLITL